MKMSDSQTAVSLLRKVLILQSLDRHQLRISAHLCCADDFPAFAGHFPGQPVLPAVIQLAVVRSLASDLLEYRLLPVKTERLKFKGMIRPGETVLVQVELEKSGEHWRAGFKLTSNGAPVATGAVFFSEGMN